jgi:hypothetical protein
MDEVGSDVVATGSGQIDLTGLSFVGVGFATVALITPAGPNVVVETGPASLTNDDVYTGAVSGPTSFGNGTTPIFANSGSGDLVVFNERVPYDPSPNLSVLVPQHYVSDTALSNTSTWDNATFASLGVRPGTYVWTWGTGADQSFTLQIVDTTPPDVTITQTLANDTGFSHTDLITSDGHVTLSGTVSDDSGVAGVELFDGKNDLGAATISNGAWTFSTLLSEGTHALYAVATDIAGNTTTTATQPTIVVDTTPPTPFMCGGNYWYSNQVREGRERGAAVRKRGHRRRVIGATKCG